MQQHPYHPLKQLYPITVIGAAVSDSILHVQKLPTSGQDIPALLKAQQIGGCAFNVARLLRTLSLDIINGMPIGNGSWGLAIEKIMKQLDMSIILRHPTLDNGWCLALVEPDGERSFISVEGCETDWNNINLAKLPIKEKGIIYVSGYEVAGQHSHRLQDWILTQPMGCLRFFDPGPRLVDIDQGFLTSLMAQNTLLTLNRDEAAWLFGHSNSPIDKAQEFINKHQLKVIIRLDSQGAWICQPEIEPHYVPAYQVDVVDSIGAGDSHCAGVITGLAKGLSLIESVELANKIAALTVSRCGVDSPPNWQDLANFTHLPYRCS